MYKSRIHQLSDTPFFADIGNLRFFFSSRWNLERFPNKLHDTGYYVNGLLTSKSPVFYVDETLIALRAYMLTEKRGFRVRQNGVDYQCPEKTMVRNGILMNYEKFNGLSADITLNVGEQ